MTTVTLYRRGEAFTGFRCEGHAGYADAGHDIVCAGISVLTITCVNSLELLAGVTPIVTQEEAKGVLEVQLPDGLTEAQRHDCQLLLSSMHSGLHDLAVQYPKYLHLFIQDRRKLL